MNCYAENFTPARVMRAGKWPGAGGRKIETWGPKGERVPVDFEPVFRRLNKLCVCNECHETYPFECLGRPKSDHPHFEKLRRIRLFADSNSDWLDPKWPVETLARFLDAIRLAPNVDVLLLTKRIELFQERLKAVQNWIVATHGDVGHFAGLSVLIDRWVRTNDSFRNVWLGVSVEDQKRADERIPALLKTPAAVRFLSVEPLLERTALNLNEINYERNRNGPSASKPSVDWVIVGGESGKNRRDCGVEAIESVVAQCKAAGVPVYVKQDCNLLPGQQGRILSSVWLTKEFPKGST